MISKKGDNPWKKYSPVDKTENERLVDLRNATREGRCDVIKILVTTGEVDVNKLPELETEGQGLTALHIAARYNRPECIKVLLESGADVNAADNFGFRPIHDAALHGYSDCMEVLLHNGGVANGVPLNSLDYITPLYYCIKGSSLQCLTILESALPDFDTTKCDNLIWSLGSSNPNVSLLQFAGNYEFREGEFEDCVKKSAIAGNLEYLQHIRKLPCRENKDFVRKHGYLLIIVAQHGHHHYLEHLLAEEKFDPNEKNEKKHTALHYAARYGHDEGVRLLCKYGADIDAKDIDGWSALHVALRGNNCETVAELINCGCDINLPGGEFDDSPLHIALTTPVDSDTLRQLLDAKPNIVAINSKGERPIDVVDKEAAIYQVLLECVRN